MHGRRNQPTDTSMDKEERILQCPQDMLKEECWVELLKNFSQKDEHEELEPTTVAGGEEHSEEWIKFFSQEDEKEIIFECEPTIEERAVDIIDFADLCEELEALERRENLENQLIQQFNLETDGKEM